MPSQTASEEPTPMFALLIDGFCMPVRCVVAEVVIVYITYTHTPALLTEYVHDFYDIRVAPLIRDLQVASHS